MVPIKKLLAVLALVSVGWLGGIAIERRAHAQQQVLTVSPPPVITLTYGATVNTDANLGNFFNITATNTTAFTIANPTGGFVGQVITYRIRNASGGVAGALTFGAAFKIGAAWTQAANLFSRTIQFDFDGTNWVEVNRAAADISN